MTSNLTKCSSMSIEELLAQKRVLVVGVCNVTPDSFSDGGKFLDTKKAVAHAESLFEQGADIVDIGGESTGPGSKPVSASVESERVLEVVEAVSKLGVVSVDTYKSVVAKSCIQAGASIINDVSALQADPAMANTIAESKSWVILMHNRELSLPHANSSPATLTRTDSSAKIDIIERIKQNLSKRVEKAFSSKIPAERIILDPGMGAFIDNKPGSSWELLGRFEEVCESFKQFPVMVGTSRKGFLGGQYPEGQLEKRDPLSQYTALLAAEKGARLIRTHRPDMAVSFLEARDKILGLP